MVADDENDQSASARRLRRAAPRRRQRLRAGRLTVVDATNVQPHARAGLVAARPRARRAAGRHRARRARGRCAGSARGPGPTATSAAAVVDPPAPRPAPLDRAAARARASARSTSCAGRTRSTRPTIRYEKLFNDRRELTGPFDIIGDVHGCRAELETLLSRLGWHLDRDGAGRPVGARHPEGRTAVFVGDLVDRGPDSPGVLRLVMGMVAAGHRAVRGRQPRGQAAAQAAGPQRHASPTAWPRRWPSSTPRTPAFVADVGRFLDGLISHYVLDGGRLVVAHAGLKEAYHGRASGRVRAFACTATPPARPTSTGCRCATRGPTTTAAPATVVYGHTPMPAAGVGQQHASASTPAASSAARSPRCATRSGSSSRCRPSGSTTSRSVRCRRRRPRPAPTTAPDVSDCPTWPGRRHLDTGYGRDHRGRRERRRRAGGDEPVRASTRAGCSGCRRPWRRARRPTVDGYLEHPAEAFADYRAAGVDRVVCEEKHMGSRAVVLVCRDATAAPSARRRRTGAVYTRTGRPFFADDALTEALVDRVARGGRPRRPLRRAGHRLAAARRRAAAVVGQGRRADPRAVRQRRRRRPAGPAAGARRCSTRPPDAASTWPTLRDRLASRAGQRGARSPTAYRRYCWPTDGLDGVTPGPVRRARRASGASHAGRDHGWHLAHGRPAGRRRPGAVHADPAPDRRPRRRRGRRRPTRSTGGSRSPSAGGEGMVVKPYDGLVARPAAAASCSRASSAAAGSTCGSSTAPTTPSPEQLDRLRQRGLGRKRGLALREHALGPGRAGPGRRRASRCGGSTSWSSPSSPANPNRSTPASSPPARRGGSGAARAGRSAG